MKTKKLCKSLSTISAVIFVATEALLFYLIHISRADTEISLRYLSIQMSALFALLFFALRSAYRIADGKSTGEALFSKDSNIFICLAMLFTLGADYFLVATPEIERMSGMIFFMGTQICLCLHLVTAEEDKRKRNIHLATRALLMVVLVVATSLVLGNEANGLAYVSVIYYANLLASLIFASRDKRGGVLLAIGLALFALCDINVGLAVLNDLYTGGFPEGSLLHSLIYSGIDLAWVFYLPSQTIIPLVILAENKNSPAEKANPENK